MANQIIKDFGKGIKQLGMETVEKLADETAKILEPIITAKELLGNIQPMSEQEMSQKKAEDERKKQEEIKKLRSQMSGRSVENEMEKLRQQQEKEKEERYKYDEKMKEKHEKENQLQFAEPEPMSASSRHKDKGGNPHKKKQEPDAAQLSQTSEFKGKIT